jgi:membrane protein
MVAPAGPGSRKPGESTTPLLPVTPGSANRSLTERLRSAIDSQHDIVQEKARWRRVAYAARVIVQVVKQWARDRCPQQAAAMAFSTALSIVPLFAIALALLRATGEFEAQSTMVNFLAREVLPSMGRDEIAAALLKFSGNMSLETAGLFGMLTTLILSFVMYVGVEQIFNDIWRVERRRSYGQQFLMFYALVTMVPSLFAISLVYAARSGITGGTLGSIVALAASFSALLLANKLLPATRVRWGPAAVGALVSALLFEAAKQAFQLYVAKVAFQSYSGVYGTLGLVPILLVWIYYSWLVVLLGAEIAHTVQNLHHLEGADRRTDRDGPSQVSGLVATRMLCAIAERYRSGGRATPRDELRFRFGLTEETAERVLRRLREGGLVVEIDGDTTGYLPARPAGDITLADVLALFRGADVSNRPAPGAPPSRLDEVLADLDEAQRARAKAVTIEELSRS